MAEHYAAWLVDLDGTLYHASAVKALMAAELAVGGWKVFGTLKRFREEHERLRRQGREWPDPYRAQVEETARALGLRPEQVESIALEWMQVRPCKWIRVFRRTGLLDEIRDFRDRGGRVGLVSDYPATAKLVALGVAELFHAIVASGEPGGPRRLKPHPEGYLSAAEKLGVTPDRCLVIGDRLDADAEAAAKASMAFRLV